MRNCRSGSLSTDRLEQYRSRTCQPRLQIDLPAARTTVSVMRGAASHSANRFLTFQSNSLSILMTPSEASNLANSIDADRGSGAPLSLHPAAASGNYNTCMSSRLNISALSIRKQAELFQATIVGKIWGYTQSQLEHLSEKKNVIPLKNDFEQNFKI